MPHDLRPPRLDAAEVFPPRLLARAAAHERFLRAVFLLALTAQLAALIAVAARADALARRLRGPRLVRALEAALAAGAVAWVARLPFGAAAHWRERRDGLSPQGWGEWLWHRLPGLGAIGTLLIAVVVAYALGGAFGRRWWLAAAPVAVVLAAAGALLQPLLAGGDRAPPAVVRDVQTLAARESTAAPAVRVEKAHERTRRTNAQELGLGPTARIVFWDTLLRRFRPDEVRFVAAHEVAHAAKHHVWKGLAWFALFALPCTYVVARAAARRGGPVEPAAVPAMLAAGAAIAVAALPVAGAISRRYEAEADWTALEAARDPAAAVSAYRRLAETNLSQPDPPRWAQLVLDDHPTPLERVEAAYAWARLRGIRLPRPSDLPYRPRRS